MQSPKIVTAKASIKNHIILTFENHDVRVFDMNPYLKYPVFTSLNDEQVFCSLSVIDGTVEWPDGAALSSDTFFLDSKPYRESDIR